MSDRPKLAWYWAASCGGCDISALAIDDKVLQVAEAFDIVFWPCVMDGKTSDVLEIEDGGIAVTLWNGAVRSSEHEHMAKLLRRKSRLLIAFGSCAQEGCIPGLANDTTKDAIFAAAYLDSPSTANPQRVLPQVETTVPEGRLALPAFYETVKTLDQTVPVDAYLPGCPPEAERIWEALQAVMSGAEIPAGTVIGEGTTVCDACKRTRGEKKIGAIKRTWQVIPDPETCLLEQGLLCAGIATRGGCGARCPGVNSPCIGCYGPNEGVEDFGARYLSGVASVLDADTPQDVDRIIQAGIPDPVGTFYRFSLPGSLLRRSARS